jgi:haloacetate dehalogenase
MAADMAGLMTSLGHDRFALVGHDRGARVVHRFCLDYPDRVDRAAVLDIVPTRHVFANVDRALATFYDHWFFLAEPPNLPEILIGGAPEFYLRRKLDQWSGPQANFAETAMMEYLRCFRDPAAIHASCEDYRAAATADLADDDAAAARGERVTAPVLALWGQHGFVGRHYPDVLGIWREYALQVEGGTLPCGHYLPEEAPEETTAALLDFLA